MCSTSERSTTHLLATTREMCRISAMFFKSRVLAAEDLVQSQPSKSTEIFEQTTSVVDPLFLFAMETLVEALCTVQFLAKIRLLTI